jgi:alkylation response protein AidB-like acyl-CoA dehydrogenase
LIPEEYGGAGLGITEAGIILEEINRSPGNGLACHAQMYTMGTLLRHGSPDQKQRYLPGIASGKLRLQAFGVTEPNAGSESTRIETRAERKGDKYIVNGQKIFISRVMQSDLMLLLARTTPYNELKDKTQGLSVFIVDLRDIKGRFEVQPLDMMFNHTQTFFSSRMSKSRLRTASAKRARASATSSTAGTRSAFSSRPRPSAMAAGSWKRAPNTRPNASCSESPSAPIRACSFRWPKPMRHVEAAACMRDVAAAKFDAGEKCGAEANMAKLLSSEAAWEAANACLDAHGGYGFRAEYDVERKFRETRLYMTAPINNNLVLAFLGQERARHAEVVLNKSLSP